MNPLDFLTDLTNPTLVFLPKALLVSTLSALVCGIVGSHVVLRGMAFIGDALAHAVFPGLAIAFALSASLLAGGAIAGLVVAVLVAAFSQNRRLKEDSIIGIFFAAAFAIGLVVISRVPGYSGSLQSFLFGSLTGVSDTDLIVVAIGGACVLGIVAFFHKQLVAVSLDREFARATLMPVTLLDIVLYLAVTAAVVMSVRTIGNILVLALLITPAATARLLTDRIGRMMMLAPLVGVLAAFIGIYLSWVFDVPTGAAIVLVATALFVLTWLLAPRRGLLAIGWARRASARRQPRKGASV
ncbi:anchored repeat-type ABC transporter permease subunit [Nanchangia anserum]|uniref:Anchored repeat-type ABC transporter permease subunit n=1 Tax=Nanchangia anserum TaxID=2692125 RepID=A0A8I0GCL0_9ACTO|nr:anchored repeat-type ABC transporter permease subunit [Nanchangia anserum]MBD3689680.1 anchored repeat-type ABC transporter permease subunit [Nanchangia anserum]QOX81857.1 anchored repeat-type ABC transporter permease subunit [Nanchangia anserum]